MENYCAICGKLIGEERFEWEGPTPRGGKPETGFACKPCGEFEAACRVQKEYWDTVLDVMLGK